MGLHKCEKETVILLNDAEKTAHISTTQDWQKRRLRRLAEENPDKVSVSEDKVTLFAEVPAKWIRIRPPREISDEQRAAAAERLAAYRAGKLRTEDIDDIVDEVGGSDREAEENGI